MESYQLGVELIGASGLRADLEVLTVLFDLTDSIGLKSAELRVGHVGITRGVVADATPNEEAQELLLDAIERKDRFEVDRLCLAYEIEEKFCSSMRRLCAVAPDFFDLNYLGDRHEGHVKECANHLLALFDALEQLGYRERVQLDLSKRDHRGYYSGLIFNVVSELADTPLGGGGRYDNLIGHFGPELPAVGFGLNADRMVDLLEEMEETTSEQPEVSSHDGNAIEAIEAALIQRKQGKKVRVDSHDTNS
jgi:ATP phosphoribosyltransferase regulatory subunit